MNFLDLTQIATIGVPILTIVGGIISFTILWTKISDKVETLKDRVEDIERSVEKLNPIWQQIQIDLAEIKITLKIYFKDHGNQ